MASYVFDHLGKEISMMPEVMVSTLWTWNKAENDFPTPPLPEEIRGQQRIDLVLFTPQDVPKNEQRIWCLIEFKRDSRVGGDITKMKSLLPLFDGCDFGAACGVVEVEKYPNWFNKERAEATARGERFVTSQPWNAIIANKARSFVVFAHLFATPES